MMKNIPPNSANRSDPKNFNRIANEDTASNKKAKTDPKSKEGPETRNASRGCPETHIIAKHATDIVEMNDAAVLQ